MRKREEASAGRDKPEAGSERFAKLAGMDLGMKKKLVMIGCGGSAEMMADGFLRSPEWDLAAFAVERPYLAAYNLLGRPVTPLDELKVKFPPGEFYFFVGIGENDLNHLRGRLYLYMLEGGWRPASWISPRASVSSLASVGKHCFIAENVVIQAGCRIGDNVIILPNSYIAHHSVVADNVFCSGGVSISGFAHVGSFSFIGANAAISNCVRIGHDCLVGIGCTCAMDLPDTEAMTAPRGIIQKDARTIFNKWHDKTARKAREFLKARQMPD